MKKKFFKCFSLALAIVLSLSFTATVYAASSESSTKTSTVYGYSYSYYAQACNDSSSTWAYTCIDTSSNVPAGYMGAWAALYNSSDVLVKSGSWYYNQSANTSCVADSGLYSTKGQYYSYGKVKFYQGSGYTTDYYTNKSPLISNLSRSVSTGTIDKIAVYDVNENGETYGRSGRYSLLVGEEPDLIAAYGSNGTYGYVRATDLESKQPENPQEAVAISIENRKGRTIKLYDQDGETIIGTFVITPNK